MWVIDKYFSNKKGQSMAELAVILPVVFFILGCVIDVGRIVYASHTATLAAGAGARNYVVSHDTAEAKLVAEKAAATLENPNANPTLTTKNGVTTITMTVTSPVTFLTPFVKPVMGGQDTYNVSGSATM